MNVPERLPDPKYTGGPTFWNLPIAGGWRENADLALKFTEGPATVLGILAYCNAELADLAGAFPAGPLPLISDAMELYSPKLQNLTHTTLTKENEGGSPQWEKHHGQRIDYGIVSGGLSALSALGSGMAQSNRQRQQCQRQWKSRLRTRGRRRKWSAGAAGLRRKRLPNKRAGSTKRISAGQARNRVNLGAGNIDMTSGSAPETARGQRGRLRGRCWRKRASKAFENQRDEQQFQSGPMAG